MSVELVKNKKHIIIKRDGREEPYNEEKLRKVVLWACDNKEVFCDKILNNLSIKINDRMKITKLYDEVINTTVNMINPLYPIYDEIAVKLYLLKIYKESYGIKKLGTYPDLLTVIKNGLKYKVYSQSILEDFTEEEINELNNYIHAERDYLFTYSGLYIFYNKYCKKSKSGQIELPQHTYMIAAMYSFCKDRTPNRIKFIKKTYDYLSLQDVTFATPRISNSYTTYTQLASCVLNTVDDNIFSINDTNNHLADYSSKGGGLAYDVSHIRASGSYIGKQGHKSDGPVPFIKMVEEIVSGFNQGGCIAENSYVKVLDTVKLSNGMTINLRKIKEHYSSFIPELPDYLVRYIVEQINNSDISRLVYDSEKIVDIILRKLKGETLDNIAKTYPRVTDRFNMALLKIIRAWDKTPLLKYFKPTFVKDMYINEYGCAIRLEDLYIFKLKADSGKYLRIGRHKVHRLVYEAFKSKIPYGMVIDHIDNNPKNNHISNLQIISQKENVRKSLYGVNSEQNEFVAKRFVTQLLKGMIKRTTFTITEYIEKTIPIREVQVGEFVKSFNTKAQKVEYKLVEETHRFEIPVERQYLLVFSNSTKIITSDHHPIFYREKNGEIKYKRTDEMKVNDICLDENNNNVKLIKIQKPSVPEIFYDLTVSDNNNYFASTEKSDTDMILIHNTRKGSCVVTFPFWHLDVFDLLMLKDAGGTTDSRARKLQYAIRFHNILKERIQKNEDITLFCPNDVPKLLNTFGDKFTKNYLEYENKKGIRKKRVKAKDLLFATLKARQETGNLYITFIDNINQQNVRNDYVGASNLCQEISVPSSPSKLKEEIIDVETGQLTTVKEMGEIGICNLISINLTNFYNKNSKEKDEMLYILMRGCDNILDTQDYPVAEGKYSNIRNRPIGIGVLNYANLLALHKIKMTDDKAIDFTNKVFDDLYYRIYRQSVELSKERGSYSTFKNDKWADGLTPVHLSIFPEKNKYVDWEKWNKLGKMIKENGVRFSLHSAVAPTACLSGDNTILLSDGSISYRELIEKHSDIPNVDSFTMGNPEPQWIDFKKPIEVKTRFGNKKSNRIWYNGKQPVVEVTFEDGSKRRMTLNHPLLTKDGWKKISELNIGDEVENEIE